MERNEKIALLEALQKGTPLKDALPTIELYLLELDKGYYTEPDQKRTLPAEMLESYIQLVKSEHPQHIIKVTIIGYEEVEQLNRQLESEY